VVLEFDDAFAPVGSVLSLGWWWSQHK
jgi:hypothetical protein